MSRVHDRRVAARRAPILARTSQRPAAGFTLLEILVVIAILGLLVGMVALAIGKQSETGRIADCRARIETLSLLLESYRDRTGDLPPARLAALGVKDANDVNEGSEALVAALRSSAWTGRRPDERWLGNTDVDENKAFRAFDGSQALLEVEDPWGSPISYIPASAYQESFVIRPDPGGGTEDQAVRAAINPQTRTPWHFDGYQLRSAGPDGLFETDDDVANFETRPDDG